MDKLGPDFLTKTQERIKQIGEALVPFLIEKNKAYGSSFEKTHQFLTLLYPDGIQPSQYGDALLLVRIFDKQMRIANIKQAFGESPYKDIAGYGILGQTMQPNPTGDPTI